MWWIMRKYLALFIIPIFAIALFVSCGNKSNDEQLEETTIDEIVEKGDRVNQQMSATESKIEERKKRGDTLALDYKILLSFIPDIPDWQAQNPEGTNLSISGSHYSTASKTFTNSKGDEVTFELMDYNTSLGLLASVSMWKNFGMESDNDESYQKVSQYNGIKDSWVYEEINKVDKITTVNYNLNDRYILTVTITGQTDLNFAKDLAQKVIDKGKSYFNK